MFVQGRPVQAPPCMVCEQVEGLVLSSVMSAWLIKLQAPAPHRDSWNPKRNGLDGFLPELSLHLSMATRVKEFPTEE